MGRNGDDITLEDPQRLADDLAAGAKLLLVDTRPPQAFARAHLPGSVFLPSTELADRYGELERVAERVVVVAPDDGPPPQRLLREAGFAEASTLVGLSRWTGPVEQGEPAARHAALAPDPSDDTWGVGAPARVVVDGADRIRSWGSVLDVACGTGRNALFLAAQGLEVIAVDRDVMRMEHGRREARAAGLRVRWVEGDLEAQTTAAGGSPAVLAHVAVAGTVPPWSPRPESVDAVVVCRYLWRPLLPLLAAAVRPGGLAMVQTFTSDQPRFGHPHHPDHLLQPGEILRAFPRWAVLSYREGPVFAREARAALIARKPMRPL
jgi:tellurite methyltransferase